MDQSKYYPAHIKSLIKDLQNSHDTSDVLKSYIPHLSSDTSLYYIFLNLGYLPHQGAFNKPLTVIDVIAQITSEYQDPMQDELGSITPSSSQYSPKPWDISRGVREEFLKTFYENRIYDISEAYDLGLRNYDESDPLDFEDNSLSSMWTSTPCMTPVPVYKPTIASTPLSPKVPYSEQSTPRMGKGLKMLSVRVKDIISRNGFSSYKEVADELILELNRAEGFNSDKDGKNILRRVYDALNVLIASDVLRKEGKRYFWKGMKSVVIPNENFKIKNSLDEAKKRIETKKKSLKQLSYKYLSIKSLINRNKKFIMSREIIRFPFIIVATEEEKAKNIHIDCSKGNTEVSIKLQKKYYCFEDSDILMKLNFHETALKNFEIPDEVLNLLGIKKPMKFVKKIIL
ncbi:Dp_5 [Blepharisma stoltei]|uniref:E2F/DP family winged-helix DNA-binding domain-containing protein n=1 Tax=Blepharisma stoltei TaxID=1481888 RepID=A0AAU9K0Y3_9CILI|nr:unnamed protein product [Blepharisma stoltei]